MNKLSLIAIIWVWRCVVNGQLPVDKPLYFGYPSTFINQPIRQQNNGPEAQLLSRNGELFGGELSFSRRHIIRNKTTSGNDEEFGNATERYKIAGHFSRDSYRHKMFSMLTAMYTDNNDALVKTREELSTTQQTVRNLSVALDGKADQKELDITNTNVSRKAEQTELDKTNDDVSDLKTKTSPSSIGSIPTSCGDLKTIGFVQSGIYSVVSNKQVQNVYCDFTKSNSTDFQKSIGYVNVRSYPVYFYAQRDGNYDVVNTSIPFDKINMNEGTALDNSTGVFLAPLSGKYFFAYTGLCWDNETKIQLQMETSGTTTWLKIGDAHCTAYNTLSIQSTLQLGRGDQVRIFLLQGTTHDDDGNNFTNYVGWLLEEDIS